MNSSGDRQAMRAPEEGVNPKWVLVFVRIQLWIEIGWGVLLVLVGVAIAVRHPDTEGLGALLGTVCFGGVLWAAAYMNYRLQTSMMKKGYRLWPLHIGLIDTWRYLHGDPPFGR